MLSLGLNPSLQVYQLTVQHMWLNVNGILDWSHLNQGHYNYITWWILQNEGAELVSCIQHAPVATGLAGVPNGLLLSIDVLKRKTTTFSKHPVCGCTFDPYHATNWSIQAKHDNSLWITPVSPHLLLVIRYDSYHPLDWSIHAQLDTTLWITTVLEKDDGGGTATWWGYITATQHCEDDMTGKSENTFILMRENCLCCSTSVFKLVFSIAWKADQRAEYKSSFVEPKSILTSRHVLIQLAQGFSSHMCMLCSNVVMLRKCSLSAEVCVCV